MKRNVIGEWRHALSHVTPDRGSARAETWAPRARATHSDTAAAAPGRRPLSRSTRALATSGEYDARDDDLARAIVILRRNNGLLRERFGVDWAGAAGVLMGEAARRGMSTAALARVLTAGLRRDARGERR